MGSPSQSNTDRRLDSWKEIAAFFERDERTVRRWEKENALPVHRIPGAAKGHVFAYEGELRQWLSSTQEAARPNQPQEPQPASQTEQIQPAPKPFGLRSSKKWVAVLALTTAALIAVFPYRTIRRYAVHASATATPTAGISDFRKPVTSDAEDFYLKGRYYWNKRTPDDLNRAVDFFTQAIVRDPSYAKAYVGLADSYNLLREYSAMPPNEAYPRAFAAATKAVELDDFSAEAHTSLAFVTFFWRWDALGAEREFKRALALNPNNAQAHHWYASFLVSMRRFPEALTQIETARRLDPSSVAIIADKGEILHLSGQTAAGLAILKQIEAAEPSCTSAHRYLSEVSFARNDYPEYLSEWEKMAVLLHDQQELTVVKAAERGFSKSGYLGMLEGTLAAQRTLNQQGVLPAYTVAVTYAHLGKKQEALKYLQTSLDKHDSTLLYLSNEAAFEKLHSDLAYRDLVARVNPS